MSLLFCGKPPRAFIGFEKVRIGCCHEPSSLLCLREAEFLRQVGTKQLKPQLLSGSSFKFPRILVQARLLNVSIACAKTAFEAGSRFGFLRIAGQATQIFDNLVGRRSKFVRTLSQNRGDELAGPVFRSGR